MRVKEEILAELQEGLRAGVVQQSDIAAFVTPVAVPEVSRNETGEPKDKPEKLSAVDVMFYISGFVLFATVMSIIVQSWTDGGWMMHILLSAGVGMLLWALACTLIRNSQQNDIRKGLTDSLLLTGSLLLVTGGYIIVNEVAKGFGQADYIPAAVALSILGALHIGFDKFVKRELILLMGVLLMVLAFPVLLFGLLDEADLPNDVYTVIVIISAGLLVGATRLAAKANPGRPLLRTAFDGLAAFAALVAMYVASFGEHGIVWLVVLITAVFGIFYLSIILQNKHLLGNGSLFLVLTIVTISLRYFSGNGVTASLIVATLGLLGSAAVAATINKKYFPKTN